MENLPKVNAWIEIVKSIPGGEFTREDIQPKDIAIKSGAFANYVVEIYGRKIRFSLNNLGGRIFASVDYAWIRGQQPDASEKDGLVASVAQPGSRQVLRLIKQYAEKCKAAGLFFRYNANTDHANADVAYNPKMNRRSDLYGGILGKIGYNRMQEPNAGVKMLPNNAFESFSEYVAHRVRL